MGEIGRCLRSEQQKLENTGDFASWLFEAETRINEQGNQCQECTRLVSARTALNEGRLEEKDFARDWLRLSEHASQRYEGNWTVQPDVPPHELLTVDAKRKASKRQTKLLDSSRRMAPTRSSTMVTREAFPTRWR
ncbi:hypothetical protein QMO14_17900 [Variovorax sp. CAN2819]|uniref:hypothetical protein n=1 Tax=Variovorax sp. CAN15 TaxID=3046727 RepID=UPI002647D237|nr:hypothetical protein [Variovorax sp. CAN15]MDN6885470.1 hypothetical protein [Variovorax sp. CAN15]